MYTLEVVDYFSPEKLNTANVRVYLSPTKPNHDSRSLSEIQTVVGRDVSGFKTFDGKSSGLAFSHEAVVFTATESHIGPFRYVVYADGDVLLGSMDFGISVVLTPKESFTIGFGVG